MENSLTKLCSDEVAHAKFEQLFDKKPEDKTKALNWEKARLAFFLAWDSCQRVTEKRIRQEYNKSLSDIALDQDYNEEVLVREDGKRFISLLLAEELVR